MAIYTHLNDSELRMILAEYGLALRESTPMMHGRGNSSYRVRCDDGEVMVTVIDEKSASETRALVRLMVHARKHGVRVPRVYANRAGELLGTWGERTLMVKEFVPGEVVREPGEAVLTELGAELGRLHGLAVPEDGFGLPGRHPYGLELFAELAGELRDEAPGSAGREFGDWLHARGQRLASVFEGELPRGVIHGDLFWDNMIVADGRLQAIIDLEEACVERLVLDIGMCILGTCCHDGRPLVASVAALMDGYRTVREPDEGEWRALPASVEWAAAGTALWRYRQYNIRYPGHADGDIYREMQSIADAVRELDQPAFIARVRSRAPR